MIQSLFAAWKSKKYDKSFPLVCMNEKPVPLLGETRERLSAEPLSLDLETGIMRGVVKISCHSKRTEFLDAVPWLLTVANSLKDSDREEPLAKPALLP